MISHDNERLKGAIVSRKNSAGAQLETSLATRLQTASELEALVEMVEKEHESKIRELEGTIVKTQILRDESRRAVNSARERVHSARQNKKNEPKQVLDEATHLYEIMRNNEEELGKGQVLLQQTRAQVELLRKKVAETRRIDVRQRRLISELHRSHAFTAVEIEGLRSTAQNLTEKIDALIHQGSLANGDDRVHFEPV
jgi:hypothetical protein